MTTADTWRPLSQRLGSAEADETLYEGVPPHLRSHLELWLANNVLEVERDVSLRLRLVDGLLHWRLDEASAQLAPWLLDEEQEADFLEVLDAVLWFSANPTAASELEKLLKLGGSAWRVSSDLRSLERRVDNTATEAVATAAGSNVSAAEHLRTAWKAAYGYDPDSGKAYSQAIKAVEAAATPVVLPNDRLATLGKIIRHLEDAAGRWQLAIPDQAGTAGISALISMLKLLWHGQVDRHGGAGPTRPIPPDAGPAAVHLAATLVQWFVSGVVRKIAQ